MNLVFSINIVEKGEISLELIKNSDNHEEQYLTIHFNLKTESTYFFRNFTAF